MRTGDGASMRRGDLKRELIRARRRSQENGNRQRLMTHHNLGGAGVLCRPGVAESPGCSAWARGAIFGSASTAALIFMQGIC